MTERYRGVDRIFKIIITLYILRHFTFSRVLQNAKVLIRYNYVTPIYVDFCHLIG